MSLLLDERAQVFRLAQFEGPLDLLLHLIKKAEIDLQDIFVSEITEQYLVYMDQLGEIDMDRASDFLTVAATLLYIKSRALLPVKVEDEETEDPETELLRRLRAYQIFKEAGEKLAEMGKNATGVFYKLPEELFDGQQEFFLEDTDAEALYQAFLSVLKNRKERENEAQEHVEIHGDQFSIRRQKSKILLFVQNAGKLSFTRLFAGSVSAMEIAVTFIGLIELWHEGRVQVEQKGFKNEIMISYSGEGGGRVEQE